MSMYSGGESHPEISASSVKLYNYKLKQIKKKEAQELERQKQEQGTILETSAEQNVTKHSTVSSVTEYPPSEPRGSVIEEVQIDQLDYGSYDEESDEADNNVVRGSATVKRLMPAITQARQRQIDEEDRRLEEEKREKQRLKEERVEERRRDRE